MAHSDGALQLGNLLNTDKAFTVILAIFLSVAIAFFFGTVVQYLSRLIFTFNYKKHTKYFIALFGGLAATSILYFMLIKGLKESAFMDGELKTLIYSNTDKVVWGAFIFFTILMQVLHWLKVNVFKVIVLMGTFALALAFAGNDLVNFIGVPLVGYSSYIDLMGAGRNDHYGTFLIGIVARSGTDALVFPGRFGTGDGHRAGHFQKGTQRCKNFARPGPSVGR